MKMPFFIKEDFGIYQGETCVSIELATIRANAKLEKAINDAPKLYGVLGDSFYTISRGKRDTHRIPTMFIESLEKEPCKHTSVKYEPYGSNVTRGVCMDCNKELTLGWQEKT